MSIQSVNPTNEEVIATFEPYSAAQIDQALEQARHAFNNWRDTSFAERGFLFRRIASYLREHKAELARLATLEMGKPIVEAEAEVEKCAWNCEFYAEKAEQFLADEPVATNASESYVAFRPLGVVLALMPWNYPYWQVLRFAAPALMAGNTTVLKHASNVSLCALEMEKIFQACGAPEGLFRTVLVPGAETAKLIEDPRIAAVTLTGSDVAGVSVAATSGHVLKKNVLELGGSDAFIVLEDADLDAAAQMAARARFQNTGQSCIAAKRFIVVEAVADAFEQKFVEAASKLRVGNPLERETQIGPVARGDLRATLNQQVQTSIKMGARVLLGGKPVEGKGYFYEPTIITGVTPEMPMFREETFGPAAAVIRARDTEHAIELANDSQFGLGGNLWTGDVERGRQLARRIESGGVFINGMTASDPRLPFGGVKRSGYGRELSSFGIREFVNIQTVWVGPAVGATSTPPKVASE
ncbi:MAG TPA: NAD-dependent succinate-semialdehyde dehydrogenase [Ktedonobacteraceae bacterium]|nr:NAD-dependent succinate-semialdehyde dehydrogenase [Ktedonobacteraceae bacterium]